MVQIPYIKIPSVRVGSIDLTTDIGTGGATPVTPTPITYLTQWKIVGNSEVHTLPYPDGVVLPTGYKRCEYLTFDGSSYIRPNIIPYYGIGVNFSFLTSATGKSILGSRSSSYEASLLIGSISDTGISIGYGKPIINIQASNLANGEKHSIILDSSQFKIDGVDYAFSGRWPFVHNIPILLGGLATGDSTFDSRCIIGNIYDTIFYDTQGELWHGIPCLDDNDIPCFYDIVSQTAFYNQGSGSFTYKLYPQPTEIWSCGEYNATDGKYHILVQPQGGRIADIALTEPLRMVNNVVDTIEFPSETEGKALVTRSFGSFDIGDVDYNKMTSSGFSQFYAIIYNKASKNNNILCAQYVTGDYQTPNASLVDMHIYGTGANSNIRIRNDELGSLTGEQFAAANSGVEVIYELATPTTELVDAPQIEEADSYSMVISQGGKAVSWSSFITESSD